MLPPRRCCASLLWTGLLDSDALGGCRRLLRQRQFQHAIDVARACRVFINSILASTVLLVVLTEVGGWRISHVGHAAGFLWGFLAGLCARRPKPLPLYLLLAAATLTLLLVAPGLEPLGWSTRLTGRG